MSRKLEGIAATSDCQYRGLMFEGVADILEGYIYVPIRLGHPKIRFRLTLEKGEGTVSWVILIQKRKSGRRKAGEREVENVRTVHRRDLKAGKPVTLTFPRVLPFPHRLSFTVNGESFSLDLVLRD